MGETKRRGFQIPCEMQHSSDSLRPDNMKERNKRERGHSFGGLLPHCNKKKMAWRIAVPFSRHPRIGHWSAVNIRPFRLLR